MTASRYEIVGKLASGGMAQVYVGRLRGALGFEQLVALKRPHAHLLEQPSFRDMFVKEAYVTSLIRHANVVAVRDVELDGAAVTLVMEYVEGTSLAELLGERLAPPLFLRIALDAANGLHAAHEATDRDGRALGLVHRDVSPQNILVGVDGLARVGDFGIAKCVAHTRLATTGGMLKGKLGYMAPEYVQGQDVDRRADVFALGIVLWQGLTGESLFAGANEAEALMRLLYYVPPPVSEVRPELGTALDEILARALAKSPSERYPTMEALADALYAATRATGLAAHSEVAHLVRATCGPTLERRRAALAPHEEEPPTLARRIAETPTLVYESSSKTGAPVTAQPIVARPRAGRAVLFAALGVAALGGAAAVIVPRLRPAPRPASAPLASASAEPTPIASAPSAPDPAPASAEPAPSAPPARVPAPRPRPARVTPPPAVTPSAPPPPAPTATAPAAPEPRPNPYK